MYFSIPALCIGRPSGHSLGLVLKFTSLMLTLCIASNLEQVAIFLCCSIQFSFLPSAGWEVISSVCSMCSHGEGLVLLIWVVVCLPPVLWVQVVH